MNSSVWRRGKRVGSSGVRCGSFTELPPVRPSPLSRPARNPMTLTFFPCASRWSTSAVDTIRVEPSSSGGNELTTLKGATRIVFALNPAATAASAGSGPGGGPVAQDGSTNAVARIKQGSQLERVISMSKN